jgi:hypothetical protein
VQVGVIGWSSSNTIERILSLKFLLDANTHFVVFPTIEIWEEFHGSLVDKQGSVTRFAEEELRKPKRIKWDPKAGKKANCGLLGGYGSEGEEGEMNVNNVLETLGGYMESDDDGRCEK